MPIHTKSSQTCAMFLISNIQLIKTYKHMIGASEQVLVREYDQENNRGLDKGDEGQGNYHYTDYVTVFSFIRNYLEKYKIQIVI